MLADERHQRIRALVATLGRVATDRIAADLGVSRETVRRDLVELEARGALRRVHGGVLAPRPAAEPRPHVQPARRADAFLRRQSVSAPR